MVSEHNIVKRVSKRDGRFQSFDALRICNAVKKALLASPGGPDNDFADEVTAWVIEKCNGYCRENGCTDIPVNTIHEYVEDCLMMSPRIDAAKEYIRYREKRNMARKADTNAIFDSIVRAQANEVTRENANMNADTPAGMMMKFASESSKTYTDENLLSAEVRNLVADNLIHIHDKDYYPTKSLTCLTADTYVSVRDKNGNVRHICLGNLDRYFHRDVTVRPDTVVMKDGLSILGRNGWTKILSITRRKTSPADVLYKVRTRKGPGLKVTGTHLVPHLVDGGECLSPVSGLKTGDKLLRASKYTGGQPEGYINVIQAFLSTEGINRSDVVVVNIRKLRRYLDYRYDVRSLYKYIGSDTYRRGNDYITLDDFDLICRNFEIPQEVLETLSIKMMEGKDRLPVFFPVTEDFATVLGYLHSEGSISMNELRHSYQISFCNYNPDINGRFKDAFERLFNNRLVARKDDGKDAGWHFSSKLLCYFFSDVAGKFRHSYDVQVPDFIFDASDEVKWSYISALVDGDGCLSDKRKLTYSSNCEAFVNQLMVLLDSLGIPSQKQQIHSAGTVARFADGESVRSGDQFNLVITGYDNIGVFCEHLSGVKRRKNDDYYASKPLKGIFNEPSEIISIDDISENGVIVYDLETAEHWYIANGYVVHNCIQHPTDKLLNEGFVDGHASVRPAKRIETAATVACITMEAVQNEMHGGQAIPAFDFYMAPYVRKAYQEELMKLADDMRAFAIDLGKENVIGFDIGDVITMGEEDIKDYIEIKGYDLAVFLEKHANEPLVRIQQLAINRTVKRVHQAMESFVHNMNTIHSRGGNQVVFSSINYGTDTSAEGRCVIREILNTTYEGVGNGETAIFPIQIWKKKRGVSYLPGDPNYDLYKFACKVTARRFFPNFLNLDASFNQDEAWQADDPRRFEHEVATMGCRTRVYENRFGPKTSIGRGNLSFTTVNLPGIALRFMEVENQDERIELFFLMLSDVLETTALQLHQRFEFQASALAKQFPMLMSGFWLGSEGLKPDDSVRSVLNQGTLGIGFIGLAECLVALTGKHHAESPESQELGLNIIRFFNARVEQFCKLYQHNYSVLATPAEGLSGRFTRIDRKRFGIVRGVTDKEYYTNSNHVPVYFHCTPEFKAKIESPYHELTRGGHIFYVEMNGDATHNPEAIMAVVDLMDKYNMGYGSVNHNRIRCMDCGYETSDPSVKVCPKCGSDNLDILQRITGYLVGTTERWNSGKKAELKDRVVHK